MVDFCPTPCKEVAISCREEEEKEHDIRLIEQQHCRKWKALIGRHLSFLYFSLEQCPFEVHPSFGSDGTH